MHRFPWLASRDSSWSSITARALVRATAAAWLTLAVINPPAAVPSEGPVIRPAVVQPPAKPEHETELRAKQKSGSISFVELIELCPEAKGEVLSLVTELGDENPDRRKEAAARLTTLRKWATPALPALRRVLEDESPLVRLHAAQAVWAISRDHKAAVTALTPLVELPDDHVCSLAAYVLGEIGPQAQSALPALRRVLGNASPLVRLHIAEAMSKIDPQDGVAIEALFAALHDKDPDTRLLAANALGTMSGTFADRIIPELSQALDDPDPRVRSTATLSLGAYGEIAGRAVRDVVGPLAAATAVPPVSKEPRLKEPASSSPASAEPASKTAATPSSAAAVQVVGGTASKEPQPAATPKLSLLASGKGDASKSARNKPAAAPLFSPELTNLVAKLDNPDPAVRKQALTRLTWMRRKAAPVIPTLIKRLNDKDPLVRAYVARAIWEIGGHTEVTIPALAALLDSEDAEARAVAAYVIGSMGKAANEALPTLRKNLNTDDPVARVHIAEAILRIAPKDTAALDSLIASLHAGDANARYLAAHAMASVSPEHSARVLPELSAALEDPDVRVRSVAALGLGAFGRTEPAPARDIAARDAKQSVAKAPPTARLEPVPMADTNTAAKATGRPVEPAKPTKPTADVAASKPGARTQVATPTASEVATIAKAPVEGAVTKDLKPWIEKLASPNAPTRKEAVARLARMRQNAKPAVPALRKLLTDADPVVRAHVARALWTIDRDTEHSLPALVALLKSGPGEAPELAAYTLGNIGPKAAPALDALREYMQRTTGDARIHAAEAVAKIDPQDESAVNMLIGALHSADGDTRYLAVHALGTVSERHAKRVTPALLGSLSDQDVRVRSVAALSLAAFGGAPGEPVEIAEARKSEEIEELPPLPFLEPDLVPVPAQAIPAQRSAPAQAAVPASKPAVPDELFPAELRPLVVQLRNDNAAVRKDAAEKLARMRRAALPALHPLLVTLDDTDPLVRIHAARAIWSASRRADVTLPPLVEGLSAPNAEVAASAAFALGDMGHEATPALEELHRTLRTEDPVLRVYVAEAIAKINPRDEVAVDMLTDALQHDDGNVRLLAVYALGSVAIDHADRVLAGLAVASNDVDERIRSAASANLGTFGGRTVPAASERKRSGDVVSAVVSTPAEEGRNAAVLELQESLVQLRDADPQARIAALKRLARLRSRGAAALPMIAALFKDSDPQVRFHAARANWEISQRAAAGGPVLVELLANGSDEMRPMAAYVLGEMGPRARPALPALRQCLKRSSPTERVHVAEAIAKIDPQDAAVLETLVASLHSSDANVRYLAVFALGSVAETQGGRALTELSSAYRDPDARVRSAAVLMLGSMSHRDPAVTDALIASDSAPLPVQPPAEPEVLTAQAEEPSPPPMSEEEHAIVEEEARSLPIGALTTRIRPHPGDMPQDVAAARRARVPQTTKSMMASRGWVPVSFSWTAPASSHWPIYFEEVNLERHGYSFGVLQPLLSAAKFYGTVPLLPYMMTARKPFDNIYTLGHYRPGSDAPFQWQCLPKRTDAAIVEAGFIIGLVYLLP